MISCEKNSGFFSGKIFATNKQPVFNRNRLFLLMKEMSFEKRRRGNGQKFET